MRSGHTEAAVDLCRLAGLPPVGVLAELVNDDGTVKRGPQVAAFAEEHGLKQRLGRRPHRLPPAQREAGRARRRVRRSTPRPARRAPSPTAPVGPDAASRRRLRRHRRRARRAGAPASRGGGRRRLRRQEPARPGRWRGLRRAGRGVIVYLREGSVGVAARRRTARGDAAVRRGEDHGRGRRARKRVARDRPRRPDPEGPRRHLDPPDRPASAAMSASTASASRSTRRRYWRGERHSGRPEGKFPSSSANPSRVNHSLGSRVCSAPLRTALRPGRQGKAAYSSLNGPVISIRISASLHRLGLRCRVRIDVVVDHRRDHRVVLEGVDIRSCR